MNSDKKALSKAVFDKDAATYDHSSKYPFLKEHSRVAEEGLKHPFLTMLDVGCGTGSLLSMIHEKKPDAKLFGADLSDEMIKVAKGKLGEKADLRVADSEHLPFKEKSFDLISCTFSFHHYPNPKAVFTEIARVLNPGGKLILADAHFAPLRPIINLFVIPFSKEGEVRIYSKKEMYALAQSAGLTVLKWEKINWHVYMMVAGKNTSL